MTEHVVAIKRRINASMLFAAWIMVFVMPAFLVSLSLSYLFNLTRVSNKRAATPAMTNEMDSFRRDLETSNFLQSRLENYFTTNPMLPDYKDPAAFADNIASATLKDQPPQRSS
jgi:hypothetical protein